MPKDIGLGYSLAKRTNKLHKRVLMKTEYQFFVFVGNTIGVVYIPVININKARMGPVMTVINRAFNHISNIFNKHNYWSCTANLAAVAINRPWYIYIAPHTSSGV